MRPELNGPPEMLPPQVFDQFTRGITDYFVDPPPGFARRLDNLLLTPQGKPYQRPGSTLWNTNTAQLNNGERVGAMTTMKVRGVSASQVFIFGQNRLYSSYYDLFTDSCPESWAEVTDALSTAQAFKGASLNVRFSVRQWRGEHLLVASESSTALATAGGYAQVMLPMKVFLNASGTPISMTAGLPAAPVLGAVGGTWNEAAQGNSAGANHNYLYYGCYSVTYTTRSGTTFTMRGTPTFLNSIGLTNAIGAGQGVGIPNCNTFGSGAYPTFPWTGGQWLCPAASGGVSSIKYELYRTKDGGTIPYLVGQVSANNGVFGNDTTPDSSLGTGGNIPLYTYDGTKANDLPPMARYIEVIGDIAYYGNCVTNVNQAGTLVACPQRVYQSSPGIIDGVPGSFFIDFEQPVMGLSRYDTTPIVFLQSKHYYLTGIIDQQGNGTLTANLISGSVGCISNAGIVCVGKQIFFPGNDGFYVCNGYTSQKISGHLNQSYAQWTQVWMQRAKITGVYNSGDNRIYWSVCATNSSTDNDTIVCLDLNFDVSQGGVFTTWSGGPQGPNWYATALMPLDDGTLIRGDRYGYTYWHPSAQAGYVLNDPVHDGGSSSSWAQAGVYWDLQTPVYSHGDKRATKWESKIYATLFHEAHTQTSLHVQFNTEKDRRQVWTAAAVYNKTGLDPVYSRDLAVKRMVPASAHRARLRSWQITKPWANVYRSDDYALATITLGTTLTLASGNWPSGLAKVASVALQADGYVTEYPILTQSGGVITVSGTPTNAVGQKWVVRNYPAGEYFFFDRLEIPYVMFGGHSNVLGWGSTEDNKNV